MITKVKKREIIKERNLNKKLIWLFLILLIFEGSLRKWVFPGLATPLLLVREPIAIYFLWIGFKKNWLNNFICYSTIALAFISFIATLLFGHQNLLVNVYGLRIYVIDFPMIFIIPRVLKKEDILKMGRFIIYISIPMTLLIIMQFYSPQSAWVNRGVGGDIEGGGFSGAMGYFRPPATFSFVSGFVQFQLLVGSFLLYYILNNNHIPLKIRIKKNWLYLAVFCYILTIPYSISRSHLFQTILLVGFALVGAFLIGKSLIIKNLLYAAFGLTLLGSIILTTNVTGEGMAAFTERFSSATETEGQGNIVKALGNRLLYTFGLENSDKIPFWGYGLGLGTSAGAKLAGGENGFFSFFNAENESSRILNECGLFIGFLILALRFVFCIQIIKSTHLRLRKNKDMLPWMLLFGAVVMILMGQWGQPTSLGFVIIFGGFILTSFKDQKKMIK